MTIYNFNGTNGDPLPVGLTAQNGSFEIQSNALVKFGASPGGPLFVATQPSLADGTISIDVNANGIPNDTAGLIFRYSNNSNFWMAVLKATTGEIKLFKRVADSFVQVGSSFSIPAYSNTATYNIEVVYSSDSIIVNYLSSPVISETDSFNETESISGLRLPDSLMFIDTLDVPDSISSTITITTDNYRIWQRSVGQATVTIEGTYSGTPTTIERSVDGAPFVTAIASPSGGIFSDSFVLLTGQYSIEYRFSNEIITTDTVDFISVGDVFACYGQSNMSGRGTSNQTYTPSPGGINACLFGNDYNYKNLTDPYNSNSGQVDLIASDSLATGSWMVRFANEWLANDETPIGFIPVAVGGLTISRLSKTDSTRIGGLNMYEALEKQVLEVGGITRVLYEQAEADAKDTNGTTATAYQSSLSQLVDDLKADLGVDTFIIPLHTITTAGYNGNGTTTGQDPIRQAQIDLVAANSNATIGQILTDIDLSAGDGIHFKTNAELDLVATRMYASYSGSVSTSTLTITGIPDGTFLTTLISDARPSVFIESVDRVYSGGSSSFTVDLPVNTQIYGVVRDGADPSVDGASIRAVTI